MEENKNKFEGQEGTPLAQPAQNYSEVVTPGTTGISDENILPETEAAAKETINPTQETDMEVHHHGHVHEKKKWLEYLFQFFMLFLAVFCGFLAEYQLEHKIERDRVKKFMHDMVVNLKNDTARCKKSIEGNVLIGRGLDSFRNEIKEAINENIHSNRLYYLRQTYNDVNYIAFNLSAITQLKNAGNLRLVNNDSLVVSILQYYDRKLRAVQEASEDIIYLKRRLEDAYEEFFDASYYDKFLTRETNFGRIEKNIGFITPYADLAEQTSTKLLKTDPKAFQQLYNKLASYESAIKVYNSYLRWAEEHAENLISQIQNEYHFE